MSAPAARIRRATAGDAAALAAFGARAFTDAYGPLNEPRDVELHVARTFGAKRQAAELAAGDVRGLLALEGDTIVGYAILSTGSRHAAIAARAPGEIRRFYVDGTRHGRGVATTLMAAVVDEARAAGCCTLWLTTWEHSLRARAFYAKSGFTDVGTTTFVLGATAQCDRLLLRRVE